MRVYTIIWHMKRNTRRFIELLLAMTEKELRARYKHTIFGFFWLVANPLLQMAVIGFIFTYILKSPIQYYYHHLFVSLLIWNFFSQSLTKATPSIVFERSLIKKSKFPHATIPISIVLSNFIHFLLALSLFLIPVSLLGTLTFMSIPFLFLGLLLLFIFTTSTSLLFCALNVRFRDVNFFVQALLIVWFYATPIVYSLAIIPHSILWIWRANPLTTILQLFQYALLEAPGPGPAMMTINISFIIFTIILGAKIFLKESKTFDDWL